ncbi:hypothetical protein SVIO_085420 [Streptomyces violaceusniger]|uniref:Uncharacterized protein n=1 Tax=Streptomyces violaceusniger TaxID=68280 RepID=A0A4D4LJ54_STRVO|nr:hypothetical protein SVIO_085420 [Streptomyces violaceusniger]
MVGRLPDPDAGEDERGRYRDGHGREADPPVQGDMGTPFLVDCGEVRTTAPGRTGAAPDPEAIR